MPRDRCAEAEDLRGDVDVVVHAVHGDERADVAVHDAGEARVLRLVGRQQGGLERGRVERVELATGPTLHDDAPGAAVPVDRADLDTVDHASRDAVETAVRVELGLVGDVLVAIGAGHDEFVTVDDHPERRGHAVENDDVRIAVGVALRDGDAAIRRRAEPDDGLAVLGLSGVDHHGETHDLGDVELVALIVGSGPLQLHGAGRDERTPKSRVDELLGVLTERTPTQQRGVARDQRDAALHATAREGGVDRGLVGSDRGERVVGRAGGRVLVAVEHVLAQTFRSQRDLLRPVEEAVHDGSRIDVGAREGEDVVHVGISSTGSLSVSERAQLYR